MTKAEDKTKITATEMKFIRRTAKYTGIDYKKKGRRVKNN
jgi:hypothetical protein